MEKTAYGAKRMPKQKTVSTLFQCSISPAPILWSQKNTCRCRIHGEIRAFEDWIFVRLSCLVLASEWTTNRNKFVI